MTMWRGVRSTRATARLSSVWRVASPGSGHGNPNDDPKNHHPKNRHPKNHHPKIVLEKLETKLETNKEKHR